MIQVQVYYDVENDRWNGFIVSVTARTEEEMKASVVSEYNRVSGESRTANDFTFGQ